MNPSRSLRLFLISWLVPVCEGLLLRAHIQLKAALPAIILPSSVLAITVLFWRLWRIDPWKLAWQRRPTLFNVTCLLLFLWINGGMGGWASRGGTVLYAALWLTLLVGTLASSFTILIAPGELLGRWRAHQREVALTTAAVGLIAGYPHVLQWLWPWLSRPTTVIVHHLLRGLGFNMLESTDPWILSHPALSVRLGPPCSGLEGMFFFTYIALLVMVVEEQRTPGKRTAGLLLAGLGTMFLLNVVRVAAFMAVAIRAAETRGVTEGVKLLLWLFHANVGWVLYAAGMTLFFAMVFRWQQRHDPARIAPGPASFDLRNKSWQG